MINKNFTLAGLLFCLACISSIPAPAYASVCGPAGGKTYVFFGNGMNNDYIQADISLQELNDNLVRRGNLNDSAWAFELSYNHNEESIPQLLEVYRQREGESTTLFWRWLSGIDIAPDWFQEAAESVISANAIGEMVIDGDLRKHVNRYRSVLNEGNKVIVTAHSQGNLYANLAYDALRGLGMSMNAFAVVSVATPANHVAGNGPYITRTDDRIINAVRTLYQDTLPGNTTNNSDGGDWLHHNFVKAYLEGDASKPLILDAVLSKAGTMPWHPATLGGGPITVTLTWGSQPDVDLHVFEPSGVHVYYGNSIGSSGYLDRDDTSGFGPEHYYVVNCSSLETGTYKVGVNYYSGSAPETANVQVQAGDVVRSYSVYLPYRTGSSGDSSPIAAAYIDVVGDATEGYDFTVRSLD